MDDITQCSSSQALEVVHAINISTGQPSAWFIFICVSYVYTKNWNGLNITETAWCTNRD